MLATVEKLFAENDKVEYVAVVDLQSRKLLLGKDRAGRGHHQTGATGGVEGAPAKIPSGLVNDYVNLITAIALPFEPSTATATTANNLHDSMAGSPSKAEADAGTGDSAPAAPTKSLLSLDSSTEQWGLVRFRTSHWDIVGYRTETDAATLSVSDASKRWLMVVFSDAQRRDEH